MLVRVNDNPNKKRKENSMCIPSSFSSWSVWSSSVGWIFGCWFNSFVVFDWCFVVYGWDDETVQKHQNISLCEIPGMEILWRCSFHKISKPGN